MQNSWRSVIATMVLIGAVTLGVASAPVGAAATARAAADTGPIYDSYDPPGGFHPALEFDAAPAGHYTLDPDHAHLTFQLQHYGGLSRPQFRFRTITAEYNWDPAHPEATKIEARVLTSSVDGGNHDFEVRVQAPDELRGYDTEENEKYRYITFESTSVKFTGKDSRGRHVGVMTGDMTFQGVTKPIVVNFVYNGFLGNRLGYRKMGYSATTKFKRSAFGMKSVPSAGDEVEVTMEFEFMLQKNADSAGRVVIPPR